MNRWRIISLISLTLLFASCDKEASTDASSSATAGTAATINTPADSVEDLIAKLPDDAPPSRAPAPQVQLFGTFSTSGALPSPQGERVVEVDEKAVAELNMVAKFRVESAFAERAIDPSESVIVQLGGAEEGDGLLLTVRYKGKSSAHKVVPAGNGPELVSNLDHTVDRTLDALGVPRR